MRTDPEHEYDALVNGAFLDRYAGRNVLDRSIIFGPQSRISAGSHNCNFRSRPKRTSIRA